MRTVIRGIVVAIITIRRNPTLTFWHYTGIFVGALLISTYLMWPKSHVREGVVLSREAKVMLSGQSQAQHATIVSSRNAIENASADILVEEPPAELSQVEEAPLRHGADAQKSECRDPYAMSTAELRAALDLDSRAGCGYAYYLGQRDDISPTDFFFLFEGTDTLKSITAVEVVDYVLFQKWSEADLERLLLSAQTELTSGALAALYVYFEKRNPVVAERVLSIHDAGVDDVLRERARLGQICDSWLSKKDCTILAQLNTCN